MKQVVYALSDILNDLRIWIGDIYRQYGWRAALTAIVVLVVLVAGLAWLFPTLIPAILGGQ